MATRNRSVQGGVRVLAFTFAAALTSCGGGGGGGGSDGEGAALGGNYFPLDAGARWYYEGDAGSSVLGVRVVGPGSVGGISGTLVETEDRSLGGLVDQTIYAVAADGVRQYATPAPTDTIERALDGLQIMRFPLRVGDTFTQLDTTIDSGLDFDGDGRTDRLALHSEITVVGLETVSTAAGSFTEALHQRQTLTERIIPSGGASPVTVTIMGDVWYGNGVGEVQSTVRISGAGFDENYSSRLAAYGVGNRRSEAVAPTVMSVTPTLPVRSAVANISAVLSEVLDRHSVGAGSLLVRDAQGVAVPGTVALQADDATLRFTPAAPWSDGVYVATLDGVTDLVGNALAPPKTWTFAIDDTAPGVVASSPGMNAVDVPLTTSTITVDFSEPVDPAFINAFNTRLFEGNTQIPVTVTASGNRVTLTLTAPLGLRKTYDAAVAAFDLAGNPMVYNLSFKTTQGRFGFPTPLVESVVGPAVAIGDVNGDGIADVLLGTDSNATPGQPGGVFLFAGQADGTLAAPVVLDVGTQFTCPATSIAIGDLDGDGRPDIALAGYGCGVQILRQTAGGGHTVGQHLPGLDIFRVVIADLDGDGSLELLGGGSIATLAVWRQGTGGALTLSASPSIGPFAGLKDLAVGDIDGDGRLDIVVALLGASGEDVGVMLQQADGSFAPAVAYAAGGYYGINRVAVGDLDGDGRAEVVATSSINFVALWRPMANGTLGPVERVQAEQNAVSLVIADIDNDGRKDIVVGHFSESLLGILYQQAGGGFSPEDLYVSKQPSYVGTQTLAVGDLNRDGFRDVVLDGQLIRQHAGGGLQKHAAPNKTSNRGLAALRSILK